MARQRKIIVRGKPRANVDPVVLARVLLAIAAEWQEGDEAELDASPDTFDAAIEDHGSESRRRRAG